MLGYNSQRTTYRAVDSKGNTIDFYLNKTRNHKAAKRFFKKALQFFHKIRKYKFLSTKCPLGKLAV